MTVKNRGGQRQLRVGQGQKPRAVVWQWEYLPTFKEAVPPPLPGVSSESLYIISDGTGPDMRW